MPEDSNYAWRSLKWHAARFWENPNEEQMNRNAFTFVATCMAITGATGVALVDGSPETEAVNYAQEQTLERYEESLDYLTEVHQDLQVQHNTQVQNALPGVAPVTPTEPEMTKELFNAEATAFLTAALTDNSLSEQDTEDLLEEFSEDIGAISGFGFKNFSDATYLDEAREAYTEESAEDRAGHTNTDAAKYISEKATEYHVNEQLGKVITAILGGGGGGLALTFLLISLVSGGGRSEKIKRLSNSPKPTRNNRMKH